MLKNSAKIKLFLVASKFFHSFFFSCNFLLLYFHFEKRISRIFYLYCNYMAVIFTDGYTFFILYIIANQMIKMILYTFSSVEFCGICGKNIILLTSNSCLLKSCLLFLWLIINFFVTCHPLSKIFELYLSYFANIVLFSIRIYSKIIQTAV